MKVNINDSRSEVDVVLPGLRFDDIDHTGQENFRRNYFLNIQVQIIKFWFVIIVMLVCL